jgi:hypothetical protein
MAIISMLQMFRVTLANSQPMIILTGYAGTLVFVLTLLSITHLQIIFNADPIKWQVATGKSTFVLDRMPSDTKSSH